ncbi:hypothetical protein jhhlp_006945 [Lomentospora prolificans]|uniref:RAVE complex protein Rav1 C-terminal domain-containing protein n=1 Tax=Lomentospora prolificans TaxID=41688 RepID=A0A2N3N364_9PEZI|nr:hypothetical protein jhhlp_006945 [Lomentospora prolificans]
MRAVLPGCPSCRRQALATGYWKDRHFTAYITGSAFTILSDPRSVVQTIYDDDDHPLDSIALDETSGMIAVAAGQTIKLYQPCYSSGSHKWTPHSTLTVENSPRFGTYPVLSWGASSDLLVGSNELALYAVRDEPCRVWVTSLPSPVSVASLSYDSTYVASNGFGDCTVQIWRRLAFGSEETHFDLSLLVHPAEVTGLQWRKPFHPDQTIENVLYTFCADGTVRFWAAADSQSQSHAQLHLCGKIDVVASIQDGLGDIDVTRWAGIVDGRDFSAAVEKAVQLQASNGDKENLPIDHIISVATKSPDICLVFNGAGIMSAWALEFFSPGTQRHPSTAVFNIAYINSKEFALPYPSKSQQYIQIHSYCDRSDGRLTILFEHFDGQIEAYGANVVDLFSPTTRRQRLSLLATWTGHSAPITKIVRNYSGSAVVSRTAAGESFVWKHHATQPSPSDFDRQSTIPEEGHIHRICVLRKGRFVIFLRHETISLWDCRQQTAKLLDTQEYKVSGKPLCLLILPRQRAEENLIAHVATVTSAQQGVVWEIRLPRYTSAPVHADAYPPSLPNSCRADGSQGLSSEGSVREFCKFELHGAEGLAYVLPVDPAGSTPIVTGFLDVFARDVAISYTSSGRVDFWTARVDIEKKSVGWLSTSSTETGITDPALVSGSTLKKAALVNATRSQFTIWDIGGYRLEYSEDSKVENTIKDLDWTSTPDSQSILAVGYQSCVVLISQMRFDYLNKGPAWAPIREISIAHLTTHSIGDSTWLGDGHLVVGAGNQIFTFSRRYGMSASLIPKLKLAQGKDGTWDMFETVQRLNGPLPVFHPQFLSQCILSGKFLLVQNILSALHNALKYLVEDEMLDNYLDLDLTKFYETREGEVDRKPSGFGHYLGASQATQNAEEPFSEQAALSLNERLTRINIAQLSGHEQIQLADIIECLGMVERHRRSLDENGARFLLFFRQAMLRRARSSDAQISWRNINWAFHSKSQDILVDFVSRQYQGAFCWKHARESGIFSWLSDPNAVRSQFERIARTEYSSEDTKDPVKCSLFYLALKQKGVLRTLWRIATWHPEQRATYKLLSNDFDDPKWKMVALKNAYALMSRRRFEYAAAFFLLGDSLQDAVNVCTEQLGDMQLAIAIARVHGGDDGAVLKTLLERDVLPYAAQEGDRWLASWAFWMLGRKDMATPVYQLLNTPEPPDIKSQIFLTDDPALVVLYSQLRQQTLQTIHGASQVTPRAEWQFVLHSAKIYDRMGCDLLGLDLVRNWEFPLHSPRGVSGILDKNANPLSLLRRRNSVVIVDMPLPTVKSDKEMSERTRNGARTKNSNQQVQRQEPDINSFLDNFGF